MNHHQLQRRKHNFMPSTQDSITLLKNIRLKHSSNPLIGQINI